MAGAGRQWWRAGNLRAMAAARAFQWRLAAVTMFVAAHRACARAQPGGKRRRSAADPRRRFDAVLLFGTRHVPAMPDGLSDRQRGQVLQCDDGQLDLPSMPVEDPWAAGHRYRTMARALLGFSGQGEQDHRAFAMGAGDAGE